MCQHGPGAQEFPQRVGIQWIRSRGDRLARSNLDVGHGGTYARPHGGAYTPVALVWLDWQLKGRKEASEMFLGEESKLKRDPDWTLEIKNFAR